MGRLIQKQLAEEGRKQKMHFLLTQLAKQLKYMHFLLRHFRRYRSTHQSFHP